MIRIVQINSFTTGGAGIAAYRLHLGLSARNDCISTFVCQNAGIYKGKTNVLEVKSRQPSLLDRIKGRLRRLYKTPVDLNQEIARLGGSYELVSWPETRFRIEDEEAVLNADIIHIHWVSGFLNFPTFFKKLKNKKLIWTFHDMNPFMGVFHYQGDLLNNISYRLLEDYAKKIKSSKIKNSNLTVIELSKWIGVEARKNPAFANFKYYNIPNGIDCEVFKPIERDDARTRLNLDPKEFMLLIVAENIENHRKGMDLFVAALDLLNPNIKLTVLSVGKGKLKLPNNIEHIPFGQISSEKELALIYSSANVFIMPSREDNLPNVMLEAFGCGIPVIGFPIGGQQDYIVTDVTGILAKTQSVESLAEAIQYSLSRPKMFDGKGISNFAQIKFDRKVQISSHIELYNSLLNRRQNV